MSDQLYREATAAEWWNPGAYPDVDRQWVVPVKPDWWIQREDGQNIAGPFTTERDANLARVWVEKVKHPETFWIREGGRLDDE